MTDKREAELVEVICLVARSVAEDEASALRARIEATLKLMRENRHEYADHCIPRFISALAGKERE